jgi:hypothetical protein
LDISQKEIIVETKKEPLLSPIMRWFLFAMVLANIGGQMSPMLMPIYLTELGASVGAFWTTRTLQDYRYRRFLYDYPDLVNFQGA